MVLDQMAMYPIGLVNFVVTELSLRFAYNFYKQLLLHIKIHRRINEKNRGFHLIPKTPFRSMHPKVIIILITTFNWLMDRVFVYRHNYAYKKQLLCIVSIIHISFICLSVFYLFHSPFIAIWSTHKESLYFDLSTTSQFKPLCTI